MPRMGRIVLPGFPHHVIQRGHNRQPVFVQTGDYARYLDDLVDLKRAFDVRVYAYCLMPNHVHLLMAPADTTGLALLMKRLAGRVTRRRNAREQRTGSFWEGRFKSSLVESDSYLLACSRYIELNPVRAELVAHPADYRWSSYRDHVAPSGSAWLDPNPCFVALGETPEARGDTYARFVADGIPEGQRKVIREAVRGGHLTGGTEFTRSVEGLMGRTVALKPRGRPRKTDLSRFTAEK